ncbi:MAG: hypothetical protein K2O31_07855 [Clostridia bacterium]|nr:hypothetical protein [Clostridia bacterium]
MEFIDYKQYGKCAKLSRGGKTMLVTVDVGPRVIYYGFDGGENIFYEDAQDLINKGGEYFDVNLPGKGIWHIYGGHRLWKCPEYLDTYYPDNAPVEVVEEGDSVTFVSETECTTGLQKTIKITMDKDGNAIVEHKFANNGKDVTPPVALWALSVMDKGAKAYIPISTQDTGLLPNRNITLWSYTDLKDDRLCISNDSITLQQKSVAQPIKIGTFACGPVSVDIKGMKFTIEINSPEGEYGDHNCNIETYTNDIMLEIETLSPIKSLAVGEEAVHIEKWSLTK